LTHYFSLTESKNCLMFLISIKTIIFKLYNFSLTALIRVSQLEVKKLKLKFYQLSCNIIRLMAFESPFCFCISNFQKLSFRLEKNQFFYHYMESNQNINAIIVHKFINWNHWIKNFHSRKKKLLKIEWESNMIWALE
jgi:hypothetical protein